MTVLSINMVLTYHELDYLITNHCYKTIFIFHLSAADSQRRMQDMVVRYEEMKQKLEWTRLTLEHTASQINQNDIKRAQQIQATVSRLKEKAEHCSGILKRKRERDGVNASTYIAENQEDTDAFAAGTNSYFLKNYQIV